MTNKLPEDHNEEVDELSAVAESGNTEPGGSAGNKDARGKANLHTAIADLIRGIPRGVHLTAPEVYRRAKEQGLRVSLSTVYRTLNNLQAHGNVMALTGEHGKRYEARDEDHDHDHLMCVKCGLTIEFSDELIRGFGKSLAERKGYEHVNSRFDILGVCPDCKAKDEDRKIERSIVGAESAMGMAKQAIIDLQNAVTLLESRKLTKAGEIIEGARVSLRKALSELEEPVE